MWRGAGSEEESLSAVGSSNWRLLPAAQHACPASAFGSALPLVLSGAIHADHPAAR